MNKYAFRNYDPIYHQLFEVEKKRLLNYLPPKSCVEHFGSTAVPNLGGKGIIDIYIAVPDALLEQSFNAIEKADYEFRPDAGTDIRKFFRRITTSEDGKEQRYHIHLVSNTNPEFTKDIAFRDYLRSHPEDAQKYAEVKKKAAAEADNDKVKYMKIKEPMIREILSKALKTEIT